MESDAIEAALRATEAQFAILVGHPDRVREACCRLAGLLESPSDSLTRSRCLQRLLPLLGVRMGPAASELFSFLEAQASLVEDPAEIAHGLLLSRDPALRRRGLDLTLCLFEEGRLRAELSTARDMAALVEAEEEMRGDSVTLSRIGAFLRGSPPSNALGPGDPLEQILMLGEPSSLRALAARILDQTDERLPADRVRRLLGDTAAEILLPLLEYTRASHRDLIGLTPDHRVPPGVLESIRSAEEMLGRPALGTAIGELGWSRIAWGLSLQRWIGLSVEGGFPVAVQPEEAALLESCSGFRRNWDRVLLVACGGAASREAEGGDEAVAVRRFRDYNVLHAELLGDILEVAPVTPAKVARILSRMDGVVEHFSTLFAGHSEDAARVKEIYGPIKAQALEKMGGLPSDRPLPGDLTRLVQMFEDPRNLDEVRTLHGLKRYLHQQGLRLAFRVFRSGRATNRTIDLALLASGRVLSTVRRIRYIDFEPDSARPRGTPSDAAEPNTAEPSTARPDAAAEIPFAAALVTEAFSRRLLHGKADAPDVELLIYGNEVQAFVSFRNHPVFIRMDLCPPLRGGMINLEYFGVSQYEQDQHPDPTLPWIQRIFRRLEFDVTADGARLHVRYDKERAFDFSDLIRHARFLCSLLPHLMEVDWFIGALQYPEPAKEAVADAWADFLVHWGVLPISELLNRDRSRIARGVEEDPSGEREISWDGVGEYRDRFAGVREVEIWERVDRTLRMKGLAPYLHAQDGTADREGPTITMGNGSADPRGVSRGTTDPWDQQRLESRILEPLREGLALGHLRLSATGSEIQPHESAAPLHEAEQMARVLVEGGDVLARAARIALQIRSVERHLRFVTTGSVQGYPVQRANLLLRGERAEISVVRDGEGIVRLAIARERPFHLGPGARSGSLERNGTEIDPVELIRLLRRDGYLTAGFDPSPSAVEGEARIRAALLQPNLMEPLEFHRGDRVICGIPASPGKSAGFARIGIEGRPAEDFEEGILFAAAVRPEDTPVIRRSLAVVSTGGGVLSHAGLIALELGKPSLIIAGRWEKDAVGRSCLRYRRQDYREETSSIGGLRVIRRCDLVEREQNLHEGDLVVVDADLGALTILGQDRVALALQQEIVRLDAATRILKEAELRNHVEDGAEILVLRGRLLRAVHQLERLLDRMDSPALARHAVAELFRLSPVPLAAGGQDARVRLLQTLFDNSTCGEAARLSAVQQEKEVSRRHEAVSREALRAIPAAENLFEVLYRRLGVLETRRSLNEVRGLLRSFGITGMEPETGPDVDHPARSRLEELRRRPERSASRSRSSVPASLSDRWILRGVDGGLELAPLIGPKAANLGEIARVLGNGFVPDWFAVSDAAFREILESRVGKQGAAVESGAPASSAVRDSATLREAIEAIAGRGELSPGRRAAAIAHLWRGVELPVSLVEEVRSAYRSLIRKGDADPLSVRDPEGVNAESESPYVAIRSSAFAEDSPTASWAGQFDTYLFIRGADALLHHIKLAMASLWTERAIDYREMSGRQLDSGGGGILVQRMVRARASGVVHTLSAATGPLREMVLNAGLGLGEGVVSGTVEVDHIVVSRESGTPEDPLRFRYLVGDKSSQIVFNRKAGFGTRKEETLYHQRLRPALEYSDLCELVRAALRLEEAYGYPLDIEFAFENDVLRILQARPIPAFQAALRMTRASYPLGEFARTEGSSEAEVGRLTPPIVSE